MIDAGGIWNDCAIGLAFVDIDGNIQDVNDTLLEYLNMQQEDITNKNIKDITYMNDLYIDLKYFNDLLERKINNYVIYKRLVSNDGEIFWVKEKISAIFRNNGTFKYFLYQFQRVTPKTENFQMFYDADKEIIPDEFISK